MTKIVHVAVGILLNDNNHILIAKRPDDLHQGGLWEFPGGKVENGELVLDALIREFKEEVNIEITDAKSFMEIHHDYGDKKVFLDVWLSRSFSGQAKGMEGQEVRWAAVESLSDYTFPKANAPIVEKLLREIT